MKIKNEILEVETNKVGEVSSIKYKGKETLHDGKESWSKTYPMIWPVTSFSTGFKVHGMNFEIPKHGFWKELDWKEVHEDGGITLLATHMQDNVYPFTIDIQHNVAIEENRVIMTTVFSNLSKDEAYFNFGHHPAFKIDHNSYLKVDEDPAIIDRTGRLRKEKKPLEKLMNMKFGEEYDTLTYKDAKFDDITLINKEYDIKVKFEDFDDLQIWRASDGKFICIEPWQGWNDKDYDAPKEAADKIGIIKLPAGQVIKKVIEIEYKEKEHLN